MASTMTKITRGGLVAAALATATGVYLGARGDDNVRPEKRLLEKDDPALFAACSAAEHATAPALSKGANTPTQFVQTCVDQGFPRISSANLVADACSAFALATLPKPSAPAGRELTAVELSFEKPQERAADLSIQCVKINTPASTLQFTFGWK